MASFERHIFVCIHERPEGEARGCCAAKGSVDIAKQMKMSAYERGLKRVVRVCKTWPGADPNAALPKGLLKQMMRFLEPFCSPVTLQKRMSGFAAELLAETGIGGGGRDSGGAADARRGGSGLAAPEDAPLPGF